MDCKVSNASMDLVSQSMKNNYFKSSVNRN